jgi:hypothetical protein
MGAGDGPDDAALQAAWHEFCDRLRSAGNLAFKNHNPPAPQHRADAFRFLTQNLGQSFDLALETRDPAYPQIHTFTNSTRKLGSDAADFLYQQAWIDGAHAYRIYGTKGRAHFFNLAVQGPRPDTQPGTGWPSLHDPFGDVPETNIFGHQITAGEDHSFELFIGGPARPGNWLPTTTGSRKLFIRQGFDSWDETPWTLRIERIGMNAPRPLVTPGEMIDAIHWAGRFVHAVMRDWPDHPYQYSGGAVDPVCLNAFPPLPACDGSADSKRGRAVANMVWRLAPDEALIVEFDPPDAFWMASLGGVFMNSLDYLYRPVSYTPSRTRLDNDGKIRLILCARDPGFANWLDSSGFEQGNLAVRTLMSASGPALTTRRVNFSDLEIALAGKSPRCTPDQRKQELLTRFHGIQRQRFGG